MTTVELPYISARVDAEARVLLLGSCFADEVGKRLEARYGSEHISSNPMGVLYNPASVALFIRQSLTSAKRITSDSITSDSITHTIFLGRDGIWHSWLGSSKVSGATEEECVEKVRRGLTIDWDALDTLIITLGTDRCYRLRTTGMVVANCHKELAKLFDEIETDGSELEAILALLLERYPRLRVVLTVSPYRYRKYGMHASQLSKAHLLMMVDRWCRQWSDRVSYFPSYEIVLDELRDYRYYKDDHLHPSDEAVAYVFDRFLESLSRG